MGRIKSALVKRTSFSLLEGTHPFSGEFTRNKKILSTNMPSKKMRNRVAGYLARLLTMEKAKLEPKKEKPVVEQIENIEAQ